MRDRLVLSSLLVGVSALLPMPRVASRTPLPSAAAVGQQQFVPNQGQWQGEVRYAAMGDTVGWLHDDGFSLRLERWSAQSDGFTRPTSHTQSGCVVRTRFLDCLTPSFVAGDQLPTVRNFFIGRDASHWRTRVPAYATVAMRGVQPGIDVQFHALPPGRRGAFEYDLVLSPGADLTRFAARCEGVERLRIDAAGRLCATVATPDAETELVQEAPIAWQETPQGRRAVTVHFRLLDATTYGFEGDDLDARFAAVVDPGVVWGTYLGGGASDSINAMRWVEGVGVWTAGWAGSSDFPTTVGAFRTTGGADGFVARLSDDGDTLQFATYLGGSSGEEIRGLALGPGNTPTVVGYTNSTDFPVTPSAVQTTYHGGSIFVDIGDGFVTRLSAAGDALLGSTYLGGAYDDVAEAVFVEPSGSAVVCGWTSSFDFPVTPGAYRTSITGTPLVQTDGFVARVSGDAQTLQASTYVGGSAAEEFLAIDRDPVTLGYAVTGWTGSNDYPTTFGALRPSLGGANDAFVTRLDSSLGTLSASTYLGGLMDDAALALRVDAQGRFWIGGFTQGSNFPITPGAAQTNFAGLVDGFVAEISANAATLDYSTFLGGPGPDRVRGIALSSLGVMAVGEAGDGFPTTLDAVQSTWAGGNFDAFATLIAPGGATFAWSSYLGGDNQDILGSVEVRDSGLAVVAGWSFSGGFPIAPAGFQDHLLGVEDGVVVKLDLLTTLGDGFVASNLDPVAVEVTTAGERELLASRLENLTARPLVVDAMRLFVGGAGDAPGNVGAVRVYRDLATGSQLVAGPLSLAGDDTLTEIPLQDVLLAPGEQIVLRVKADLTAVAGAATSEVAAAVLGSDGWLVHATGAGTGPEVRVLAPSRVEGPVLVLGDLPGDVDHDGDRTVVDVRRQIHRLGTAAGTADVDGDGLLTNADVAATRDAILGRATLFGLPSQVARASWLRISGVFPSLTSVQVSIGGRALQLGRATPRQLSLFVDATQATGTQDLVLTIGGRVFAAGLIEVL